MTDKHTPTIKKGAERKGPALVWFLCSCGDSGSAQKTQAAALEDFQAHVDRSEAAERLERIRAASPELLEALENIMPLAQTGFSAMTRREQTKDQQAILRAAREAIEAAKS
jgi:pyruvate/2-oxoacid:ferredoxin oxidoreductase beta subunit